MAAWHFNVPKLKTSDRRALSPPVRQFFKAKL